MDIKTATLNGVASIELARPRKKNALTMEMYAQMTQALEAASADAQTRAVLIHGQPEVFTAGADLEDFVKGGMMDDGSPLRVFMRTLSHFEKPVVAAITGPAIGMGTTMLMHCDLVYAADTARFAMPFVTLGVVPEFGSSYMLPRLVGHAKAAELLLLAQPFGPQEALEMKLVNAVLPEAEVVNHARRMAERFNKLPPAAVREAKRLMRVSWIQEVDVAIETEVGAFARCVSGPEAKEAVSAFFEKRWPDFSKF